MKLIRLSIIAVAAICFLFTSCKKESNPPTPIVVNAGPSQSVQLPTDSVVLTGTVTSGQSPTLAYSWTVVVGPNTPVIVNGNSTIATVKGLIAGTYIFQFEASNGTGTVIGEDTVSVIVAAPSVKTLTIQPANNPNETFSYSYTPNQPNVGTLQLPMWAWTVGGVPVFVRSFIKFDLSQIPSNATILNAKFSIYSMSESVYTSINPGTSNPAQFGTANECYIQRITSPWTTATLDWNNMPSTTTVNEATIPESTSGYGDATDIDVTSLVQDLQTNGNNGFAFRLINETYYNQRWFTSSTDTDPTRHPKLVITYQ